MKTQIVINGDTVEITLTPEQLASIEAQKKPTQFVMEYKSRETFMLRSTSFATGFSGTDEVFLKYGRYRKTKESAELSLVRNKRASRLEALADQLGGLREFVEGNENWYVYNKRKKWLNSYSTYCYFPEAVYMTEECATRICEILNNGEYEL